MRRLPVLLAFGLFTGWATGKEPVSPGPAVATALAPRPLPRTDRLTGADALPVAHAAAHTERGLASWYGRRFHGRRTASGEVYDMYAMTAAHRSLPMPSYLRVRNLANGREVVVRVNDRGPFIRGRVIDLSYAAAQRLDLLANLGRVELTRITAEQWRDGSWRHDAAPQPYRPGPAAKEPAQPTDGAPPPEPEADARLPASAAPGSS